MLLVDCTEPGQTREDSVSRIPQKAGNTHAGAHGSGDLCFQTPTTGYIHSERGMLQHESYVRPEGECNVPPEPEWEGTISSFGGAIILPLITPVVKKARKALAKKNARDEEKPTLINILARPCAPMAPAICASAAPKQDPSRKKKRRGQDSNLQSSDHEPDELTIPLPRFIHSHSKKSFFDLKWLAPTLIDSGALLLQSLLIDNQEKKRRSTYSTTAFRRSNEEKNFSVRREAECSVIEAEDKEKGEREAILIVLVPPKGSVLDLVVKNLTETIFFALRNRSNNSGLRASTTIGYLTLGESGREGAASRRRHPLRFAKESCGAVKGSRWGSRLSWSPPTCGRGGELILRCQGARRRPQVEATDALVIPVDSLLPVRACCHAGKSGAFGLFLISKVARGRKMRIQSRRSGRMVEESMDSLGIDSRWLDIRVTTGREEERSTTELLATSCKGKDKTTFRTFLLVQTFE
ncbi:hypothetical protein Tco_0292035 [Tanacetum coccineum]